MEYKFTKDGKKVGIIDYINDTDVIVQEVFINEKDEEFLGGRKFVVQDLYEFFPCISYEQRQLAQIKANYDKDRSELQEKIRNEKAEITKLYESLRGHAKWLRNVAKQPFEDEIKRIINSLCDFFECKDMWVGYFSYYRPIILPFRLDEINKELDRFEYSRDMPRLDAMRLISLYGRSDGTFSYCIDEYGYGASEPAKYQKEVFFFRSKQEALVFVQNWVDKQEKYTSCIFDCQKEYGINLDPQKVSEYYDYKIKCEEESINKELEKLNERSSKLGEIKREKESLIKSL